LAILIYFVQITFNYYSIIKGFTICLVTFNFGRPISLKRKTTYDIRLRSIVDTRCNGSSNHSLDFCNIGRLNFFYSTTKLILFFLFIPTLSFGQNIIWSGDSNKMAIGDQVEILEDTSGTLSFEDVQSDNFHNQFKQSDNLILSLGYSDSFFWLRFTVNNQSNNNIILELAQAGLPVSDLYYQVNDSLVKHTKAGYEIALEDKQINSSYQVYPLPPGKTTCYIRLNSNSEPVPVNLYEEKSFEIKSANQKIRYGIYLGLMIFVILNNIFLFISLRKRLYLFYALIVLMYIGYSAAVIDGFLVYFISKPNLKFLYTSIPAIGITLQTIYCLIFLEVKKYTPKVFKTIIGIVIYFGIWMIIKFFLSFPIVQPINTVNALISFLTMSFVGVKVGTKGNKMGYYFAIAYFIYFLLVAVQALYINTGSPEYIGGLSFVAYATLIEAFLLSFLLTRRFEWEKEEIEKEKHAAKLAVLEKTLENEKIIEDQKIELEHEVVARTAQLQEMNIELKSTNERLVDLNREKDGLVNIVAHDLKSPICTIVSYLDLIKQDGSLNNKQIEYIEVIDTVTQNGMYLIDDLLDVHSNEYGDSKVRLSEIDLHDYISDWSKTFEQELKRKQQDLLLEIDTIASKYRTDQFLLSRILNNLLSNAIKFSEKYKTIHLKIYESDSSLCFSVRDEGPGISINDQKNMFKRFQKLSARPTASETSNGLGLSIIKTLTEKLNGQIIVKSELGMGTEFIIKFPK